MKGTKRAAKLGLRAVLWAGLLGTVEGCDQPAEELEPRSGQLATPTKIAAVVAPLPAAHCSVNVSGVGTLDVEEDYLPQVIFCENNGANFEALKAQAIAARSVAYYNMETEGSICDSQGCQVFTCNGFAEDIHRQAVEATSGIYLSYNSILTYGFYVAGDSTLTPPACVGNDADASTEHYVTYNEGRSGTDVEQTDLGLVISPSDSLYGQNRGCMSQWGSRCLENDAGYDALQILQYYYGEDIELLQAQGPCVLGDVDVPVPDPTGPDTGSEPDTMGGDDGASSDGDPDDPDDPDETDETDETDSFGDEDDTDAIGGTDGAGAAFPDGYGYGRQEGCACRSSGRSSEGTLLVLLAMLGLRRRRSR